MRSNNNSRNLELLSAVMIVALLAFTAQYALSQTGEAANYRNVSVTTTVNITNSFPEITRIAIQPDPATLNAGGQATITANVTIRDYDGFNDIDHVSAVFFDAAVVTASSPDDNNNHYSNVSCTRRGVGGFYANFTCDFDVWYYANPSVNWTANITVNDTQNFTNTRTNTSTIDGLLALNVTNLIDFGNLAVGDISASTEEANVTNFGNLAINVSVYGYGATPNDGLAMVCDQRNISVDNERFSLNSSEVFTTMTQLAAAPQNISGLTLPQRTDDGPSGVIINSTYWRIQIPVATNPAGQCNGTVVFQAESSTN